MRKILSLAFLLVLFLGPVPATAQEPEARENGNASFDVAAATDAYLARLTPEERERSDAYFEGSTWLTLWGFLYGLVVATVFLVGGLSRRMRDLAERFGRWRWLSNALYALQYALASFALGLPLSIYQGYWREHRYDLSNLTLGGWFTEQLKGLGISLVLGTLALVLLYAVLQRSRRWWLWGTLVSMGLLMVVLVIAPVYLAPIFNDYEPVERVDVREAVLKMAREHGVPANEVYVFDASRQSTRISANVSGFLGTQRISLNDNLLERTSLPEIEAVMGHELGHYVLGHINEAYVYFSVILAVGFAFSSKAFEWARERWGEAWGIRGIGDIAGLPLLSAVFSIYFFLLTPVFNSIIRSNEAEADAFGLAVAQEPEAFAEVALRLSEYRKLDPGPWERMLFFDHPSGRDRIERAMRWRAENPKPSDRPAPRLPSRSDSGEDAGTLQPAPGPAANEPEASRTAEST